MTSSSRGAGVGWGWAVARPSQPHPPPFASGAHPGSTCGRHAESQKVPGQTAARASLVAVTGGCAACPSYMLALLLHACSHLSACWREVASRLVRQVRPGGWGRLAALAACTDGCWV